LSVFGYWSSFSTEANLFFNLWIWKWAYTFSNYTKQLKSRSSVHMSSPLWRGGTPPHVLEEEEASGVLEEEETSVGVEEEPPPTSLLSRPSQRSGAAVAGAFHLLHVQGRRSGAVAARASHLLHTLGRRSGAAATGASHLIAWGRRSGEARGRSKPPIAVLGLPLYELWVLANHRWPNVEKIVRCKR
jgi:hypothetical protein